MGIPSMNQNDDILLYDGSRAFVWLSDLVGIPVDQVNFLISQFTALGAGFAFRYHFHPSRVSAETRHGIALLLGLFMVVFCFGRQALHLACLSTISYAILMTSSPKISHKLVLISSLLYLSGVHIKRQLHNYGSYTLDISGPLMVLTQKVTSLAFSLHDGRTRKNEDLTQYQKEQVIHKCPNPLEYYSYVFHFHALMVGPTILFADYIDFINGKQFAKRGIMPKGSQSPMTKEDHIYEPSATFVVFKKLVFGLLCAFLFINVAPLLPISRVKDDNYLASSSLWQIILFLMGSTTIVRMKYYHAWLLADAICNASGLGFNGYDAQGNAKWDLISNVDIFKFEFGLSLRDSIENWNKCTTRWLRFIVYERTTKQRTVLTYILSAIWHGFYPGYYLTFMGGALFTVGSRAVRRSIRPYFIKNQYMKMFYDFLTFMTTRIVMGYVTFSFVLLELLPSLRVYWYTYFCLHILSLAAILLLPKLLPPPKAPPVNANESTLHTKRNQ